MGPEPVWWIREVVFALIVSAFVGGTTVAISIFFDEKRQDEADGREDTRQTEAQRIEDDRQVHSERLENLRFVRERSSPDADMERPFATIDLQEQNLSALQLAGANFEASDLRKTRYLRSNLSEANFYFADLRGADIVATDLSNAFLVEAKLQGVRFFQVDLRGANVSGVEFDSTTRWEKICYDEATMWPKGRVPSTLLRGLCDPFDYQR